MSNLVQIVDIPGIDDDEKAEEILNFIPENIEFLLPIVICPLTGGCINNLSFNKVLLNL